MAKKRKTAKRAARKTKAIAVVSRAVAPSPQVAILRAPAHERAPARRRRPGHARGHGHAPGLVHLAGATVVLQSAAGTEKGPAGAAIYNFAQKIPGAKTFGGAAAMGLALGALGRFTRVGGPKAAPWLKAAGAVGVVLAISKAMGEKEFKWLGDANDECMDADI